jgi:cytochrome c553
MRTFRIPLFAGLLAAVGGPAAAAPSAADQQALRVRSLAATCAQCHGTDGRPAPDSVVPRLAGRPEAATVEVLLAFKAGTRPATVMTQLAKGYSDVQIRQLAAYFAAQR